MHNDIDEMFQDIVKQKTLKYYIPNVNIATVVSFDAVCMGLCLLVSAGAGVRCESSAQCGDGKACMSGTCSNPCQGACDEESFCEVKGHVPSCFQPGNIQSKSRVNVYKLLATFYTSG